MIRAVLICAFLSAAGIAFQSIPQVRYPAKDIGVDSLPTRARAQEAGVGQFDVDYHFRFTDRLRESGITFVHRVVDDSALNYKAVHYDHGSGVAAADVDGDGRPDLYFVNQAGTNELWRNVG